MTNQQTQTSWNSELYEKFADERNRPAEDLMARIPLKTPEWIIDLPRGPGNQTAILARRRCARHPNEGYYERLLAGEIEEPDRFCANASVFRGLAESTG